MTLDQYLKQFIEGYLLEDLRSMAAIGLPPGKTYGVVGYPMVMTTLSGIELLGVLTSRARFNRENGAARFGEFWRNHLYPDERPARQPLDSVVYDLIRHGLAHLFMTKPMVRVTKHHDSHHLTRDGGVLCIDALSFAEELTTAYTERVRPNIDADKAFRTNMEARFLELRQAYWQEHEAKQGLLIKVPLGVRRPPAATGHFTQVNSPAVPGLYSTIVTTTDFGDPNDH